MEGKKEGSESGVFTTEVVIPPTAVAVGVGGGGSDDDEGGGGGVVVVEGMFAVFNPAVVVDVTVVLIEVFDSEDDGMIHRCGA